MKIDQAGDSHSSDAAATAHEGRRPGRPREQRADRAIIDATLELFAEDGYHALSMEAVAAKAEVSKATIYRRWAGKRELVIDALASLNDDFPKLALRDRNSQEWLLMAVQFLASRDANSLAGRIMPRMMTYQVSQPDLYAEYFDRVILPRRRWMREVLVDGIERGELRGDVDIEVMQMAIVGPVLLQSHSVDRRVADADLPGELMKILWPGLRAVSSPVSSADPQI